LRNAVVSEDQIARYQRDGAILIPGALGKAWVDALERGLNEAYHAKGPLSSAFTNTEGEGETFTDQYASLRNETLANIVAHSPLGAIAARLMRSQAANYILDQIFYKKAGWNIPTPYHQDTPYVQASGYDLARTWVCCDHSPPDVTVGVVRGSHRWNVTYSTDSLADSPFKEVALNNDFEYLANTSDPCLPAVPDVVRYRESFDILTWDVHPGDVLVFNGNVLHGSFGGPAMPNDRRALAVLWGGDDARYLRRHGISIPDLVALRSQQVKSGEFISARPDVFCPVIAA